MCKTTSAEQGQDTSMQRLTGVAAADALGLFRSTFDEGKVVVHANNEALNWEGAKVYEVTSATGEHLSVTIPVEGGFSTTSNVTGLLDRQGELLDYSETLVSKNASGNFAIERFSQGGAVSREDTDKPFMTNAQLHEADLAARDVGVNPTALGIGGTVGCVASVLGVSGFTAYLIVGACTGACAVPGVGTAVCVACIGAYATVGGASVAAVSSCFR